ncbi:MAG: hypothetical protein IJ461_03105 [Clostridia bacterium]|nr:hypothetical protein [Clostridia bacterium]
MEKWPNAKHGPKKRPGKPVDIYPFSLDEMCKYHIQQLILRFSIKILPGKGEREGKRRRKSGEKWR